MDLPKLFFNEERKIYFYVTYGENPLCSVCKKEIKNNLIYHTIWRKNGDLVRTYHLSCCGNISNEGLMDEFKTCAVVKEMPNEVLPIFERSPSTVNVKGLSTFQTEEILKKSEAEVKDKTRISKDPNQSIMLDFKDGQKELEKRDLELGHSILLLNDMRKEIIRNKTLKNQTPEEKQAKKVFVEGCLKEEVAEEIITNIYKDKKSLNEKDIDISTYFEIIKESELLLPFNEENKKLEYNN